MRKNASAPSFIRSSAFTLVELLVVVAIMAILVAILLPGIGAVRNGAKKTKARLDVAALQHAFKAYYNEYAKWPGNLNDYNNWPASEADVESQINGIEVRGPVVRMLAGENVMVGVGGDDPTNPRQVVFLEVPAESLIGDAYLDPWGNPYKYMLDFNYDNNLLIRFSNFSGETNLTDITVGVWCRGKDLSDEEGNRGDDLTSWQ